MSTFIRIAVLVVALGTLHTAAVAQRAGQPEAPGALLLHVPFDTDTTPVVARGNIEPPYSRRVEIVPGKVGDGAASIVRGSTQLIYDGPGNAYTTAGTLSFFWRLDEEPANGSAIIVDLSPFERINYNRLIRLTYAGGRFSVYFTAGHRGASGPRSNPITITPGQWHHVALAWDQTRGLAVYLDGEQILADMRPWVYEGHFNQIALGQTARADYRPGTAVFSQSFDELRSYDRWLTDAALASLGDGRPPMLEPLEPAPLLEQREATWRWNGAAADGLPRIALDGAQAGLTLRQVGVTTAKDVGRTSWRTFDGERARRWPGGAGYADAGEALNITLEGPQTFNAIQIYGQGHLGLAAGETDSNFLELGLPDVGYFRRVLPASLTTDALALRRIPQVDDSGIPRRTGGVYELALFEVSPWRPPVGEAWQRLALQALTPDGDAIDQVGDALAQIRRTFYTTDQQAVLATPAAAIAGDAAKDDPAPQRFTFPAMRPVHIVLPPAPERRGIGGIALELAFAGPAPTIARIEVTDPLTPERFLTAADVAIASSQDTSSPAVLRLRLDHRNLVLPPDISLRFNITFNASIAVDLAQSVVHVESRPVAEALPEHLSDQMSRAKDVFQEISEARSWHYYNTLHAVGMLHHIIEELLAIAPGNEVLISYWHWINPGLDKAIVELPPVPPGVPAWAVYLDAAIEEMKKVPYWWIDHRANRYGEFGANDGINDDTDLVMDWWAMHLMRGPDAKLAASLKAVADRSWTRTMRESGLGHYTDSLHHYEDGINAQCHMALMDYGNPVYLERLMATARHYKDLLGVTEGHLHFYDDRYGYTESKENPGTYVAAIRKDPPDRDEAYNALTFHPAILLGWYNGNEYCIDIVRQWTDSMLEHMIVTDEQGNRRAFGTEVAWRTDESMGRFDSFGYGFLDLPYALWDLTGEQKYLDFLAMAAETEIRRYGYPRASGKVVDRYIAATGDPRFEKMAIARGKADDLWQSSLHNDNYYKLDGPYFAWQYTRDTSFIDNGLKVTLNDILWELPMLTEGEQSTDRVWTPQRLANRVALGGPAMLRNELYPKHGASWENATGRIAPFVTQQNRTSLHAWIQNLEPSKVTVTMRLWKLEHGQYTLEQGLDADHDGAFDADPAVRSEALARYGAVELTLPPGAMTLVRLTQTQPLGDIRQRPDLAICADDARFDPGTGRLHLVVHNIGAKPTGRFTLRISSGDQVLRQETLESLEAPVDLLPRTTAITVEVPGDADVTVELDQEGEITEITEVNNRLTLEPAGLPSP